MIKRGIALWLLGIVFTMPVSAQIYTLFSDNGLPNVPPNTVPTFSGAPASASYNGQATDSTPPEGYSSWKTTQSQSTYTGWGLAYSSAQNLSQFNSGELRFWVYTNDGNIQVEIKEPGGTTGIDVLSKNLQTDLGWNPATDTNQWRQFRVSLAGVNLSTVQNPFLFTELTNPVTFYIDDVRYVDTTTFPIFNVKLCNIGDAGCVATPTQITWTGAAAGNGWAMANQYIQLTVDPDAAAWGVQIYTDNTAVDANPKFTSNVPSGQPGSNPAGLVNTTAPSQTLSMGWTIIASTVTMVTAPADPNVVGDWFYFQDKATPSIPSLNTSAFVNGEEYVTIKNNVGIQPFQPDPYTIYDPAVPPNPIYLEANFATALGGATYQTSTIRVEYYYP
jgi:hypothetical protein